MITWFVHREIVVKEKIRRKGPYNSVFVSQKNVRHHLEYNLQR